MIPKLETRKANRVLILNKMYEVNLDEKKVGDSYVMVIQSQEGFFPLGLSLGVSSSWESYHLNTK